MRAAGAIWIALFLFWLPIEDTQIWPSLVLGGSGAAWLAWRAWPASGTWWTQAGFGAAAGLGAVLAALALMAFKGGLHAHGFADFTPRQVWELVQLAPAAMLAGTVLGIAIHSYKSKFH